MEYRFVPLVNARDNLKWILQKLPKTLLTPLNVWAVIHLCTNKISYLTALMRQITSFSIILFYAQLA